MACGVGSPEPLLAKKLMMLKTLLVLNEYQLLDLISIYQFLPFLFFGFNGPVVSLMGSRFMSPR